MSEESFLDIGRFGHLLVFECWHKQFIRELVPSHAFRQATIEVDAYA